MFLHLLNKAQKESFLILAQRMSMIDGEDDMSELDAFQSLKSQLGLTHNPGMTAVLADTDVSAFTTYKSRVIAMLELLRMVYADDFLHDAEAGMISDISAAFGFDQEHLNALATWAMDAIELTRRGEALMDE